MNLRQASDRILRKLSKERKSKLRITDLGAGVIPKAINNIGQIVAQDAGNHAILWTNGSATILPTLGGATSFANALNDSGTVVGWSLNNAGQQKPFYYNGTTMMDIEPSATLTGAAEAINNNGETVGWRTNGSVIKSAGGDSDFSQKWSSLGVEFFPVNGQNDFGLLVGRRGERGFLYDYWTVQTFDINSFPHLVSGFGKITNLADINNDGTFTGTMLVDGVPHGFVADFAPYVSNVPEPSSFLLCTIATSVLFTQRTRILKRKN